MFRSGVRPEEVAASRALIRVQLRIALGTCAVVLAVVAVPPLLLVLVPGLGDLRIGGVPLVWPLLALGVQPLCIIVALRQLRHAERAENAYRAGMDTR
ncbi:hypothetical protein [Spirillospora albida]|uniref:hypothetical protein n=1 Tax=Spirillospora albida TaxID=58123 RepID=UPI00068D2F32|nr:hypothetical protein [Spirillospora albida]